MKCLKPFCSDEICDKSKQNSKQAVTHLSANAAVCGNAAFGKIVN